MWVQGPQLIFFIVELPIYNEKLKCSDFMWLQEPQINVLFSRVVLLAEV